MPKRDCAVGVDIGGTSVKLGVVDDRGNVVERADFLTDKSAGRAATLDVLASHVLRLAASARRRGLRVRGVGIGAPGPIDVERGLVYFFPNIPGWKNTPLRSILERKLKMPVALENDANAMALGEFTFGAGKGVKDGIALTLGTGVGGGIVMGGRLFHGPTYSAAEIGHLVLNEDGPRCGCGSRGCIETYVGNGYFVKEARRRMAVGQKTILRSWLKEGVALTPYLIWQANQRGDAFARRLWVDMGTHLGNALTGLVNILNPRLIVIGGGVAQKKPLLFRTITNTIKKKAFPVAAQSVRVVPAALGTDAGLIGAAALILSRAGRD